MRLPMLVDMSEDRPDYATRPACATARQLGRAGSGGGRMLARVASTNAIYSVRNARMGSMRPARIAGIKPAAADTMVSSTTVQTAIAGSVGFTP